MMPNKAIVFLGPTLSHMEASNHLDAIFLPPAEQGSIVRAVRTHDPDVVILIDGVFGKTPSVRHKEILWALAQGVSVFGAASMGALRAAELAPFGMRGHGFIYRWYALSPLADDDEVAVAMCPADLGSAALSEALVNIRLTLTRAMRAGIITPHEKNALEQLARDTHFVERTYESLLATARSTLPDTCSASLVRLARWLPHRAVDRKRDDAVALFDRFAHCPELWLRPTKRPGFTLTEAWAYDLEAAGLWGDDIVSVVAQEDRTCSK